MNAVTPLKLGLVQMAMSEDTGHNRQKVADGIAEAAGRGANLVLLPELHQTEYFCKHADPALFDLAEPLDGPTRHALADAARAAGVVVVGSIFERRAPGLAHNTALVLDADGTLAGVYRKMHIPDDPGYHEKFYFTPGDTGFVPIQTRIARLGVMVCWDQWFPESARLMALSGADLLLYPTAIGWDPGDDNPEQLRQLDAWRTIQRSHAVANGLFVAACNRVGFEPDRSRTATDDEATAGGARFWGHSLVAGPQGEILDEAGTDEEVLVVELDRSRTESVRRIWPFLRDRRIDAYHGLLQRYGDHWKPD